MKRNVLPLLFLFQLQFLSICWYFLESICRKLCNNPEIKKMVHIHICFSSQRNCLIETVLFSTHNICLGWEIRKNNLIRTLNFIISIWWFFLRIGSTGTRMMTRMNRYPYDDPYEIVRKWQKDTNTHSSGFTKMLNICTKGCFAQTVYLFSCSKQNLCLCLFNFQNFVWTSWRPRNEAKCRMYLHVWLFSKKAFDLVNHNVLLKRFKYYKLSHEALTWFASDLGKRKQKGFLNNVYSEDKMITDGVPQGSIFGPLLFHVY